MTGAQRALELAYDLRSEALGKIAARAPAALGGQEPQAVTKIAGDMELLLASDVIYSQRVAPLIQRALSAASIRGGAIASSHSLPNLGWLEPSTVETRISGKSSTAPANTPVTGNHGSTLTGTGAVSGGQTKPLSPSSPTKVTVAADLAFKVTFKNIGSFQEAHVPVTLTVSVFGKRKFQRTEHVSSINPDETHTVSFANLQLTPSAFAGQATVNVVVGRVPGEHYLTDNHASYPVFFSLSSGG